MELDSGEDSLRSCSISHEAVVAGAGGGVIWCGWALWKPGATRVAARP
jgi:hypothetical protein